MGISTFPPSSGGAASGVTYNSGAQSSRPSSPEAGTTFFNQTNQNLEIYTGTEWKLVSSTNNPPTWNTAEGSLGSHNTSTAVSYSVSASDAEGGTVTYTLLPSNKPGWLSINSSTGSLTGTSPTVSASTSHVFTVYATDSYGNQSFRDFSITTLPNIAITYAVIAGGGGGRRQFAGGGAGGVRDGTIASAPLATDMTVTVGAGGAENTNKGNNSVFYTITSTAGGGGGADNTTNRRGGSGGGGNPGQAGGIGNDGGYSPVEGYNGGFGKGFPTGSQNPYPGGGGGGASGAGGDVSTNSNQAGSGGGGRSTALTGTVGGGGGGASYSQEGGNPGGGGSGGGGSGNRDPGQAGGNGSANSGGGGGGSGWSHGVAGAGGSGYVVIRYPSGITMNGGTGLTFSTGSDANYNYRYFTAGTGTVSFS